MRLQMGFIILESFHALGKDREDMAFLDSMMYRQAWKSIDKESTNRDELAFRLLPCHQERPTKSPRHALLENWDAVRRYIGRDIPLVMNEPSASCSPEAMSGVPPNAAVTVLLMGYIPHMTR